MRTCESYKNLYYVQNFFLFSFPCMTINIDVSKINDIKKALRKPHVNADCIGCNSCTLISEKVFEIRDDGLSYVLPLENYEGHDVDDSIAACPVNAISWQEMDENGEYLHGVVEHKNIMK